MRDAHTLGLSLSIIVCSQANWTPLLMAAYWGRTDCVVELVKAKANIDHKDKVRVR